MNKKGKKILIMGLPGSGKSYLAEKLQAIIGSAWFNADNVRKQANDWEFSIDARLRQSKRMKNLADFEKNNGRVVICDFVCPTKETRNIFQADIIIWMDTVDKGRYEDTNNLFEQPDEKEVHFRVKEMNDSNHLNISDKLKELINV